MRTFYIHFRCGIDCDGSSRKNYQFHNTSRIGSICHVFLDTWVKLDDEHPNKTLPNPTNASLFNQIGLIKFMDFGQSFLLKLWVKNYWGHKEISHISQNSNSWVFLKDLRTRSTLIHHSLECQFSEAFFCPHYMGNASNSTAKFRPKPYAPTVYASKSVESCATNRAYEQ